MAALVISIKPDVITPSRLNFAGYCIWCGDRYCTSARCIALHAKSSWIECDRCGGTGETPDYRNCNCYFGVIQA